MTAVLLLLLAVSLSLGPVGQIALTHPVTPNLVVVFLWATTLTRGRGESLRLAIFGGLLLDLVGFSYFGLWTATSVMVVLAIDLLKVRFLESASFTNAILSLTAASLVPPLLISIVTRSFVWGEVLLAVLGNVVLGMIVYYLLAMRFKLFQRWAGQLVG